MWLEILIALLGKLAILASIVSEARAASDVVGLLGVMGAVGAVVGVASTATSAINEVVGSAVAGTADGGLRPRAARWVGAGASCALLLYGVALAVVGAVARNTGGAYSEYAGVVALAYAIDAPIYTLLRVMRKSGARGRAWGLASAIGYALPATAASLWLAHTQSVTPAAMGWVCVGAAAVGAVPCAVWAVRKRALAIPRAADIAALLRGAWPLLRGNAVRALIEKPAFAALVTTTALTAPAQADVWGAFMVIIDALWMVAAQMQGVAGDRLQRALGSVGEARAEAEFRHVQRVSCALWLLVGAVMAPFQGLPWWVVALTLPRLVAGTLTRPLEARKRFAELGACVVAGALTTAVVAAPMVRLCPDAYLLSALWAAWAAGEAACALRARSI
jgi:hypothetical protein